MASTFGHYLKRCYEQGIIDFSLRCHQESARVMRFYIHPTGQDGGTEDFHVVGDLTISSVVDGVIRPFPVALIADCAEFAMELPNDSCPKCHTVQLGTLGEKPWFVSIRGGRMPDTPDGPGESWVDGIQTCFECGHQWEITL